MKEKVVYLSPQQVEIKDHLSRTKLDIGSLAESIEASGQINPITVKKVGKTYQVIAGRRRATALKLLSKKDKTIKIAAIVKDIDAIAEELIVIDENLMRQQLGDTEVDEALYRRKQLYEQLHPETKKNVAGGHGRAGSGIRPAFSTDAAKKLGTSRKSVERAIARASKATDKVKEARLKGLSPSKVDLLVSLEPEEQNILLPLVRTREVSEVKSLVEAAKRRGAKAVVLDLEDHEEEDKRLKPLIKEAMKLSELIQEALEARLSLKGSGKHDNLRALDKLQDRIQKFTSFQRAALGYVRAISRKEGQTKFIRGAS